jgi:DNA (cytosine-5)-methyltransferase 1
MCSGVGAPEMALEKLGVEHSIEFACEIDKYARQTYLANYEPKNMYEDLTTLDYSTLPDVDLFVAGFPCQSFSIAGKRKGTKDPRGTIFFNIYEYLKVKRPPVFILENVKGLLSDDGGATFRLITELLSETVNGQGMLFPHPDSLRYHLFYKVLNAKDYGVPQNRERIFLVGFQEPRNFEFPAKMPLHIRLKDILVPDADPKYYLSKKLFDGLMKKDKRHKEKGNGFKANLLNPEEDDSAYCLSQQYYKDGKSNLVSTMQKPNILDPEKKDVAYTLLANYGKDGCSNWIEDKVQQIGNINRNGKKSQGGTIYSIDGVSPCLNSGPHGYASGYIKDDQAKIIQVNDPTHSNDRVYHEDGLAPTLRTHQGGNQHPFVLEEPAMLTTARTEEGKQQRRENRKKGKDSSPRSSNYLKPREDGIAGTLLTNPKTHKDNLILEPEVHFIGGLDNKNKWIKDGKKLSRNFSQGNRVYDSKGVAVTQSSGGGGIGGFTGLYQVEEKEQEVSNRIRRLTPLECFRLMGFPDDFKKPVSETQQYKQAGNSIVVNVLEEIFKSIYSF